MKKQLFLSILLFTSLFIGNKLLAQVNIMWDVQYASPGLSQDIANIVRLDASGNVFVTGTSFQTGSNSYDIVTIKYDNNGIQQGAPAIFNGSGNGIDEVRNMAIDNNGDVYITGFTTSTGGNVNYITIKYDNSLVQQWAVQFNGPLAGSYDEAYAIAVDNAGFVYVTGGADFVSAGSDYYTIKYDASNGNVVWGVQHNGVSNGIDAATSLAIDAAGNVYVTGRSFQTGQDLNYRTVMYNSSGVQQWATSYNGPANSFESPTKIKVDASGNVYVTGFSYGGQLVDNDYATVKYNSSGVQQWAVRYNGPLSEEDNAYDLEVDNDGNVYVTGRSKGIGNGANIVTLKYGPNGGVPIWTKTYNGPGNGFDEGRSMILSPTGSLYVTGTSAIFGTNNDYITLKYDTSNGNILWEARYNGPANDADQAYSMALDAQENVYVTGGSKFPGNSFDYNTIKWCQFGTNAGQDTAICVGDSAQLNAIGGITFTWSPIIGLSCVNCPNPKAAPLTTTTYVVTAVNSNGCIDTDTITVTVNALPNNSITPNGPTTFCQGDSVTLFGPQNMSWLWLPNNQTTQSIVVKTSGTYTLIITDNNNCAASAQQVVTVNPLPNVNAGNNTSVCSGSQVQLNATGANTYVWSPSTGLSCINCSSPFAGPLSTIMYYVTGTDINNCKNMDSVIVTVLPSPTASFLKTADTVCLDINPNIGLLNTSINSNSRLWDMGDGTQSTSLNVNHTYTLTGNFTITLIAYNNTCADTAKQPVVVMNCNNSVNNFDLHSAIDFFPNPADQTLFIRSSVNLDDNTQIRIFDITGKTILLNRQDMLASVPYGIDVQFLENGVYFIELTTPNQHAVFKFIKTSY